MGNCHYFKFPVSGRLFVSFSIDPDYIDSCTRARSTSGARPYPGYIQNLAESQFDLLLLRR